MGNPSAVSPWSLPSFRPVRKNARSAITALPETCRNPIQQPPLPQRKLHPLPITRPLLQNLPQLNNPLQGPLSADFPGPGSNEPGPGESVLPLNRHKSFQEPVDGIGRELAGRTA